MGNNWCHDLYFKICSIFPTFQNSWHTIALRLIGWVAPSASPCLCPVYPVLPSCVSAQKSGLLAQAVPLPFEFLYLLSQLQHSYVSLFDLPHKALFFPRHPPPLLRQWGPLIPLAGDVTFTGSQSVAAGYLFLCDLSTGHRLYVCKHETLFPIFTCRVTHLDKMTNSSNQGHEFSNTCLSCLAMTMTLPITVAHT